MNYFMLGFNERVLNMFEGSSQTLPVELDDPMI
jgi:hypothetical protein